MATPPACPVAAIERSDPLERGMQPVGSHRLEAAGTNRTGEPQVCSLDEMQWASAISEDRDPEAAADTVTGAVRGQLGGPDPDLAFLFCAEAHRPAYDRLAARVRESLPDVLLIGCSARSVIGGGREVEGRAALSLTVARLPGVDAASDARRR